MTRREAAEKIFYYISKYKFMPYDIQYGSGYFIIDMGEDGVVHFKIKGLHGWKFAMWIETDPVKLENENGENHPAVQFFCQHNLNIDKFKPARSFFCASYSLKQLEDGNDFEFYKIDAMLKMIKRHPFVAFSMDQWTSPYSDEPYIWNYLNTKFYMAKEELKEWIRDTFTKLWHGSKVWFINKYEVVETAKLKDNNGDGWKSFPRYDMDIHFKKISDDEDVQADTELRMLNRWFRQNRYKNMHLTLTREGIEGRYFYSIRERERR